MKPLNDACTTVMQLQPLYLVNIPHLVYGIEQYPRDGYYRQAVHCISSLHLRVYYNVLLFNY
jgi:hypothetical protein